MSDSRLEAVLGPLLEGCGYQVQFARDGEQALALVAGALPILAIIDLCSNGEGLFLLPELKRRFGCRPFPIVVLSDQADVAEQACRLFGDRWLPKPVDEGSVIDLLRHLAGTGGFPAHLQPSV